MTTFFWILVFIVLYTYVGYWLVVWIAVKVKERVYPPRPMNLPTELPEITLLIAAYNEESVIDEKMANCHSLNYPKEKLKIVWVTDGSTDRTNEKLQKYSDVEVLFEPERKGKTAAINRAIAFVSSSLTIFTDANTLLNEEAVMEILLKFTDPTVGCVSGEKRIITDEEANSTSIGEGFYWKYESKIKALDARLYSAIGAAGELFAIRTSLYEQMPEDTLLDDFILSLKIAKSGYRIEYCTTAYASEKGSADIHEEAKRKIRIAAGGIQAIGRLPELLNPIQQGVLSFQYISHRVLRWTITPLSLLTLFPLNLALVYSTGYSPLYLTTFILQILFYSAAWIGDEMMNRNKKIGIFYVPYYFYFMNENVLKGYVYLFKRRKSKTGIWEKAKRSV